MTRELKWYTTKCLFNTKKINYGEIEAQKRRSIENKWQDGRHKSYLINNYIICKKIKHSI